MDILGNRIKEAFDDQLFNRLYLTETEAFQFATTIKQKSMNIKPNKRLKFIMPTVALCLVLIISIVLFKTFINNPNGITASIEERAEAEFDKPIFIPQFEKYPIIFSAITKPSFMDKPTDLTISYGNSKGTLDPAFRSTEQRNIWEKKQESILLYGPYNGKQVISIEYRLGNVEFGDSGIKDRVINGMHVQYEHFKRNAGEFVVANINTRYGGYNLQMFITKDFTFSDSERVLQEITRQMKSFEQK